MNGAFLWSESSKKKKEVDCVFVFVFECRRGSVRVTNFLTFLFYIFCIFKLFVVRRSLFEAED
jgi:hypothetical protein